MMKKLIITGMFSVFTAVNIYASGPGISGGEIVLEGLSARMKGLAQAGVALNGTGDIMLNNPAGIYNLTGQEVVFMYRRGFAGETYGGGVYTRNFKDVNSGVALQYYSTGKIELYDTSDNRILKTGQKDVALTAGLSKIFYGYPVGINLKIITSEVFGNNATAFAVDMGMQYPEIFKGVSGGLAIRNLGTELKYISDGDKLPLNAAAGISYSRDIYDGYLNTGLEVPYFFSENQFFALMGVEYSYCGVGEARLGYRINISAPDTDDSNLQIGMGVNWQRYRFDYSMGISKALKSPHNISVKTSF
ncbi:MAG: PorV/PorQ family protein [Elusimicrobiota bacterium]